MGRGILVLSPEEQFFLDKSRSGIGAQPIQPLSPTSVPPGPTSEIVQEIYTQLQPIVTALPDQEKAQTYRAWMGYYNSYLRKLKWTKEDLVREANLLAVSAFGWTELGPPPIEPKTAGMMGLRQTPGLNIVRKAFRVRDGEGDGAGKSDVPRSENVKFNP